MRLMNGYDFIFAFLKLIKEETINLFKVKMHLAYGISRRGGAALDNQQGIEHPGMQVVPDQHPDLACIHLKPKEL